MIAWLPQLLFFQDKNWALAGPEVVCLIINFCQFPCTGLESREQTGRGCKTTSLFVKEKRRRKGQVCFYRGGLGQLYPALPPATYFLGQNPTLTPLLWHKLFKKPQENPKSQFRSIFSLLPSYSFLPPPISCAVRRRTYSCSLQHFRWLHKIELKSRSSALYLKYCKKLNLTSLALTWIINADIVHGQRFRDIGRGVCGSLAFVWWRSMVTIIGQDGKQNHEQQLEQTASDGKFQTHFQLCATKSIDEPVSGCERLNLRKFKRVKISEIYTPRQGNNIERICH